MDFKIYAKELLNEFDLCLHAKSRHNAVDVQLEKDACAKWAHHLNTQLGWGTENEIAEACHQLEPRLKKLKEKLIIEILKDGPI